MKRDLPVYMQRALHTGERSWEGGPSRNHLVYSGMLSAFQCGWDSDDYFLFILDPKNLAGEKYQAMPRGKALKALERDWDKAVDWVTANPRMKGAEGVRKRLERQTEEVKRQSWTGRTGKTDRQVLLAMLSLAHERGTYTPSFGDRAISLASGKAAKTVRSSLARLRESGHIKLITPATSTKAAVYEITSSSQVTPLISYSGSESSGVSSVELTSHDIFTYGCLGSTALQLWSELSDSKEYTVKEMARATGLSKRQSRDAANKLASVGLMSKREGKPARYRVESPYGQDPAYLDQIMSLDPDIWEEESPDLRDHVGKGDKRAEVYKQEREAQKLRFAKYDRATGCYVDRVTGEVLKDIAA